VKAVVGRHGVGPIGYTVSHLIRPDQSARDGLMVQDVHGEPRDDVVCVLIAVTGIGLVRMAKKSTRGYRKSDQIRLRF
jgi:hypothetical protein